MRAAHHIVAAYLVILLLSGVGYSADILLLESNGANSLEQRQLQIVCKYYGVGLRLINASVVERDATFSRTVGGQETVAIIIEANALGFINQQRFLRVLQRKTDRAIPVVIVGITPETDPDVLQSWSAGVVEAGKRAGGKFKYLVGSVPDLAPQLVDVEFPFPTENAFYLAVSPKRKARVIMSVDDGSQVVPVFIEATNQQREIFLLSRTFPEGDVKFAVDPNDTVGAFTRVAPLMMLVKYCAGNRGWHSAHHYANLTIDDPWLREQYGYLDYKHLLQEMENHNFHTTIAFIPWNYDRSEPAVVELFRNHSERFSICIHGNNHDHDEFTEPHSDKVFDIKQSLARMAQFERITDIHYDPVMVFPHNIGSEDLLKELKTYNFLATVNSSNVPSDSAKPADVLSALRPVTLAYSTFPSVSRYSADMVWPKAFVAINEFLDNPLFFYSHHSLFASGSNAFDGVADLVNKIQPDTRWRSLGEIARHLYIVKQRGDSEYDVRAFSATFELENTLGRDAIFYVSKQEGSSPTAISANLDGKSVPFDMRNGEMQLRILVANGEKRRVEISYRNDLDLASIRTSKGPAREYALRMISDFRDIWLSGLPLGAAISEFYYKHHLSPVAIFLATATLVIVIITCAYGAWHWRVLLEVRTAEQARLDLVTGYRTNISENAATPAEPGRATRYVVITPIRDEEKFIEATIASVRNQTVPPAEWIIVNDGSTDRTGDIVDYYAREVPWIRTVHRDNRGFRQAGGGVIESFYDGYTAIELDNWDFIVKLDGDLTLPENYFEKCFEHFEQDPKLGIGGGDIYHDIKGAQKLEENPKFHVRGATKIYRRACWEAIGGLWKAPGWDTIDEVKANMLGWKSYSFGELRLAHHRITGSAEGALRDRIKHGVACYVSGYHPLFLTASCISRLVKKPYVAGSVATAYGFLKGYWKRMPRVKDRQFIKYLRTQQLRRLCGLDTIWK